MNVNFKIKNLNQDTKDTISTFLARTLAFTMGLAFKIYIARELTVEENGIFGKWLATYNYALIVFSFGLNLSMIYYYKLGLIKLAEGFFYNTFYYFILITPFVLLSLILNEFNYYGNLFIAVFVGLLISTINSIQLAKEKVLIFNATEIVRSFLILAFFYLYISTQAFTLDSLYSLYLIPSILTFLVFFYFIDDKKIDLKKLKEVDLSYIFYGIKGLLLNVMGQALYIIDIFIIGYLVGDRYLGLYVVAGSIARLLWFFVDAAGTVIFPRLINKYKANNLASKETIYHLSSFSFLLNLIALIVFYYAGKFLIDISFGEEYIESFNTIIVLFVASHGMVIYKLVNRFLAANDMWKFSYISLTISLALNIILNIILIPQFNIVGAAIASLISYWACGIIISKTSGFELGKLFINNFSFKKFI